MTPLLAITLIAVLVAVGWWLHDAVDTRSAYRAEIAYERRLLRHRIRTTQLIGDLMAELDKAHTDPGERSSTPPPRRPGDGT